MAKFRITGPDGGTYEVTAPDGASQEQVLAYAQQHFGGGGKAPAPDPADPERQRLLASTPMRLAKGGKDPIDGLAQLMQRVMPERVVNAVNKAADAIGGEGTFVGDVLGIKGMNRQQLDANIRDSNIEYEAARQATAPATVSSLVTGQKQDPGFDGVRLVGNILSPANVAVGRVLPVAKAAAPVTTLARQGAVAGAAGAATQPVMDGGENFWSDKATQAATGAVFGGVATPAIARGGSAVARKVQSLAASARGAPTQESVRVAVSNTFASQGMNMREAPREIVESVQRQVDEAMRAGNKLDPAAMLRKAQFEAVGLTDDAAPTLGQMTRDPMQFANEKNLSGVRIRTPQGEGNQLADRFQAQNNRLGEVFDQVGAREATDRVTAGQTLIKALQEADAPVKGAVDDAYTKARGMTGGRAVELDRATFSKAANGALNKDMLGRYVPPEVRGMLNDVSDGTMPFTVEAAEQFDSVMSAAQRQHGQGTPQYLAISRIRQALHDAPFMQASRETGESAAAAAARTVDDMGAPIVDVPFRPAGGPQKALPPPQGGNVSFNIPQPGAAAAVDEGAAAREAFAQARAAARSRFARIEDTPALKAALDEAAPDKFVQQFVLNAGARDVAAMRKVLENNPDALAQARAQVAEHLKRAAFGENPSGDKAFAADRYLKTLRGIGKQKLEAFFSPAEMVRLNLAGKVASDINSIPAGARYGTNTSGSGAAVMNLLSRIAESPAVRQLPFARTLANQLGEIRTERAINQALSPPAVKQGTQLSPEAVRALEFFLTPAGIAGGVAGAAAVN